MTHTQLSLGSHGYLSTGSGWSHPLGDLCFHRPSQSSLRGLFTAPRHTQKATKAPRVPASPCYGRFWHPLSLHLPTEHMWVQGRVGGLTHCLMNEPPPRPAGRALRSWEALWLVTLSGLGAGPQGQGWGGACPRAASHSHTSCLVQGPGFVEQLEPTLGKGSGSVLSPPRPTPPSRVAGWPLHWLPPHHPTLSGA